MGSFQVITHINDKLVSVTFNVVELCPFDVGEVDSMTNLLEESGTMRSKGNTEL